MEFTITSAQLLGFLSFVSALWGVYKIVKEIKKPGQDLRKTVEEHTRLLDQDNVRMKDIEKSNKLILQSLLTIINHDITGNGIEQLKDTREDLQEYLINK